MDAMVTYKIVTFAVWVKNPRDTRPRFHLTWATNSPYKLETLATELNGLIGSPKTGRPVSIKQ